MSLFILQTVQKFGETIGDVLSCHQNDNACEKKKIHFFSKTWEHWLIEEQCSLPRRQALPSSYLKEILQQSFKQFWRAPLLSYHTTMSLKIFSFKLWTFSYLCSLMLLENVMQLLTRQPKNQKLVGGTQVWLEELPEEIASLACFDVH